VGDESNNNITLSKDAVYGSVIVVLFGLFIMSVFTQGFGLVGAAPCECPEAEQQVPDDTTELKDSDDIELGDAEPAEEGLQQLTVDGGGRPFKGDEDAVVSLVHFSEFPCPYCSMFYANTEGELKTNYIDTGKMKFYFRDYIVHPVPAVQAAQAARCAEAQGYYWEMHDKLFETRDTWVQVENVTPTFIGYAAELGLDNETFTTCFSDPEAYFDDIILDMEAGQNAGVGGTPSSFLVIPKSSVELSDLQAAVDSVNAEYGVDLPIYENDNEYTIFIVGAYPYEAFDTILSTVSY